MVRHSAAPLALLAILFPAATDAQDFVKAIDTQRSSIAIHVGKAGLFSAAAHEHWVDAPIAAGTIDAGSAAPAVRFTVNARRPSVRPEKDFSEKDRQEVERNMHGKVLESASIPEIAFRSTRVQRKTADAWSVSGDLTLHGTTRPVAIEVTLRDDVYTGLVRIRQTDFGIQPITIAGGIVKVKNELEITFKIYTAR